MSSTKGVQDTLLPAVSRGEPDAAGGTHAAGADAPRRRHPRHLPRAYPSMALVLALGLLLRAVLLPLTSGPDFKIWELTAAATLQGQDVYSRPPLPVDRFGPYAYVPLYLYLLLPLKWLALHTGLPYVVLGKLPVVAGDVGVALGIAAALRRAGCSVSARALGAALFFLNPLALYNGPFYGRFDSLPLAMLLLAWQKLPRAVQGGGGGGSEGRGFARLYALAVALKTFPIFLLPYLLARLGPRRGGRVALTALGLPLIVSLPYLLHDARRFLYIVLVYDSTKGPRQFSWQVALLRLGLAERTATIISYALLAAFALALLLPLTSVLSLRKKGRSVTAPLSHAPREGVDMRGAPEPYAYVAVAFTLFVLLSKVVYEQYLLWPLPFLAILAVRDRARDALGLLLALSVCGLLANRWIHPFGYTPYPALWLNGLIAAAAALFALGRAPSPFRLLRVARDGCTMEVTYRGQNDGRAEDAAGAEEQGMTAQRERVGATQTMASSSTGPRVARERPVYSVVAPIYNEEETLPHFYRRLTTVMEELGEPYEIVLVNDGSRDDSYHAMRELHKRDPRVVVVDFSRNFGHQIAISAGLDHARGDAVVIIDSDLQDPPEVIAALVARWKQGAEVVYAQRRSRVGETRFKLLTAAAFYRLIGRLTSIDIPRDTGDFRLLDRKVVDTLVRMREHHRFMRGLSVWVGFRQEAVSYDRAERFAGETKYPLSKMVRFSLDAITSFSHVPLQLATTLGFIIAGVSFLGIIIAAIIRIVNGSIVGQGTTISVVLFLGGIQLIFLGVIGEYLGRIYDEVRARPLYIAREVLGDDE